MNQAQENNTQPIENPSEEQTEKEVIQYPLRNPAQDPRWALGVVWTWIGIAVFLLLFFVVLILLGFWYD
jgi:hypothetical protein